MTRDEALRLLGERRDELEPFGVRSLALFGSVARDEATPGSDVDILVEFEGTATFDRYMDLKFHLQDVLGRPVDLVTRKALKPLLAPYVARDALYVA